METITKTDNILIARFMGDRGKILNDPKWIPSDATRYLKYHESWDWLMPVVEKIEFNYVVRIYGQECEIRNKFNRTEKDYYDLQICTSKIEAVYRAVVEFIKWHNKEKSLTS